MIETIERIKHENRGDNQELISNLLNQIRELESKLEKLKTESEINRAILEKKSARLREIKHGLTEINERMERPYIVSPGLQAVRESLEILSQSGECNSVILEGEPGTGKTQWFYSEVGQELQEGKDVVLIHIRVKDTMRAQDLLYRVDNIRRLSDAQSKSGIPEEIRKESLFWRNKILEGEIDPASDTEYKRFAEKLEVIKELGEVAKDLDYSNYVELGPLGEAIYQSGQGKKVYLLIDEIEKGREELMTGILDEIENLTFQISETGRIIKGRKEHLRIAITTNSEDADKIPSSFRRRSLYYYVEYPSPEEMKEIVDLNFPDINKNLLDYAISIFYEYHDHHEIKKKPSTPELLAWIKVLEKNFKGSTPSDIPHKEILLKYLEDREVITDEEIFFNRAIKVEGFDLNSEQKKRLYDLFLKIIPGFKNLKGYETLELVEREPIFEDGKSCYVLILDLNNYAWLIDKRRAQARIRSILKNEEWY